MSAAALLELSSADQADVAERIGATEVQVADLARFQEMLTDWNQRLSLVSPGSLADFWPRHVFDSAQLLGLAPDARVWVDIGAGAGFPGLVVAVLSKGRADTRIHLVESLAKKCRFLAAVVEQLNLPAEVHNARAENLTIAADVVTARAVAPLERLLGYARPYLSRGAVGLFLKGQNADAEVAAARQRWRFDVTAIPSRSDPAGRILKVGRLARVR